MSINPKLEPIRFRACEQHLATNDAFDEEHLQDDLARFASAPGILEKCAERVRIRFRKRGERAVLRHWTHLYEAGERLIAARTEMERRKNEFLQLGREHEVKDAEKLANLAKLQADTEEHCLRRDKASNQRQHPEEFANAETPHSTEHNQKFNEADERRQFDSRWELHESLRALQTLIELQRWRRQQRDRILKDPALSPEEQSEDLRFVDELYQQKHAELKVDARIFEES